MHSRTLKFKIFCESLSFRAVYLFILLFILSFSFPHRFIPDIGKYTAPLFENLVRWTSTYIYHIHHFFIPELISDSTGFYLHTFNCIFIAIFFATIWAFTDKKKTIRPQIHYLLRTIITYYIILQLFDYGFYKIFKWQFPLPEPNILFTPAGNLQKDILYWSVIGVSRPYVIFLGISEITIACLLIFRRTRSIGAIGSILIFINIVAVNFCFDISVKLYSCFLLFISIVIALPALKKLFTVLFFDQIKVENNIIFRCRTRKEKVIHAALKSFVISVMLYDTASMYFETKNFNDDIAQRPPLYGAYDIFSFIRNSDTIPLLVSDTTIFKRLFIHRRGYLITQDMQDNMQDYFLETDTMSHLITIADYHGKRSTMHYTVSANGQLQLEGDFIDDSIRIYLNKINISEMPLLQKDFHWTIDEYN